MASKLNRMKTKETRKHLREESQKNITDEWKLLKSKTIPQLHKKFQLNQLKKEKMEF